MDKGDWNDVGHNRSGDSTMKLIETKLKDYVKCGDIEGTVIGKAGDVVYIASHRKQGKMREISDEEREMFALANNLKFVDVSADARSVECEITVPKKPSKVSDMKIGDRLSFVFRDGEVASFDSKLSSNSYVITEVEGTLVAKKGSTVTLSVIVWDTKPSFHSSFYEIEDKDGRRYQSEWGPSAACFPVEAKPSPAVVEEANVDAEYKALVRLSTAKIGDRVKFFVPNQGGVIQHSLPAPTDKVPGDVWARCGITRIEGTVLDHSNNTFTIGWGNTKPITGDPITETQSTGHKYQSQVSDKAVCNIVEFPTKRLVECSLGDTVEVWLNAGGGISNIKTDRVLRGVIYAKAKGSDARRMSLWIGTFEDSKGLFEEARPAPSRAPEVNDYIANDTNIKFRTWVSTSSVATATVRLVSEAKSVKPPDTILSVKNGDPISIDSIAKIAKEVFEKASDERLAEQEGAIVAHTKAIKALTNATVAIQNDLAKLASLPAIPIAFLMPPAKTTLQPGDRVSSIAPFAKIEGTIVGVVSSAGRDFVIMGWKGDENTPLEASKNYQIFAGEEMHCVSDIHSYQHYLTFMSNDLQFLSLVSVAPEGTKTSVVHLGDELAIKDTIKHAVKKATEITKEVAPEAPEETAVAEEEAKEERSSIGATLAMAGGAMLGAFLSNAMGSKELDVRVADVIEAPIEEAAEMAKEMAANG